MASPQTLAALHAALHKKFDPLRDGAARYRIVTALDRNALVEAGAGTGKTHLTISRILHGIATGRYRLARLVIITFTEKAAGELRDRLRSGLEDMAASGDRAVAARGRQALTEIEYALVTTIHSFCAQILREFPLEADVDPAFQVADETLAGVVRMEVWRDWIEAELAASSSPLAGALQAEIGLEPLREVAFKLCDERDFVRTAAVPAPQGPPPDERLIRAAAERLEPLLKGAPEPGKRVPGAAVWRFIRGVVDAPWKLPLLGPDGVLAEVLVRGSDLATMPRNLGEADRALVLSVHAELAAAVEAGMAATVADAVAGLKGFVDLYVLRLRQRGLLDFADLLISARDLVRGRPDVRDRLKGRYDALFVDEFQDTDPLQAEIVFLLSGPVGETTPDWTAVRPVPGRLFIVGDPKQSIFRFRRADLRVYGEAVQRFADDECFTITTNFRSNRRLIEGFDALFSRLLAEGRETGCDVPTPRYQALIPRPDAVEGEGAVVLLEPPADMSKAGGIGESRDAQAQAIASMAARMVAEEWRVHEEKDDHSLATRPCRYGDMAVLLRKLTDVATVEEALQEAGVPFRLFGGKAFYQQQEIQYAVTLLRAIDSPLDAVAVVGALRSPVFGISDAELIRYRTAGGSWTYTDAPGQTEGPVREAMEQLRRWHADRLAGSPVRFVERVMAESAFFELNLTRPQGTRRVANLGKLLDQLRAYERTGRMNFHGIVEELSELALGARQEVEEESVAIDMSDPAVRILTIHKAKGLEFPIVFVPFLGDRASAPPGAPEVLLTRRPAALGVNFSGGRATAGWAEAMALEDAERREELLRLLYVALTRACSWLVLPWEWPAAHGKSAGEGTFQAVLRTVVDPEAKRPWLTRVNAPAPAGAAKAAASAPEAAAPEALVAERARVGAALGAVGALSRRESVVHPSDRETAALPRLLGPEEAKAAPIVGDLFHRTMQYVPFDADARTVRRFCESAAADLGVSSAALVEDAARLAASALEDDLIARARASARALRELPIAVPLDRLGVRGDPRVLEGVIDLAFEEDGRTVIVDYKTDHVGPDECEAAAAVYLPQIALYARALHALRGGPEPEALVWFVRPGRVVTLTEQVFAAGVRAADFLDRRT